MPNFIPTLCSNAPRAAGRLLLALAAISILVFLVAPVIAVMPMSLSSSITFELLPESPGFDQYRRFFTSPDWMLALARSMQVGIGTTIVATTLGTLAALGIFRMKSRWRSVLEAALLSSRIVPTIVFAVGAYYVFSLLGLAGTIWGLIMAHSVIAIPFVLILVTGGLQTFDRSLEDASRSLGAGPITTFFRVTFPQIRLSIFGGALFAFNISFDEVIVSLFLSGVQVKTLPVKIWDSIQFEITPILPAISTMIILASVAVLTPALLYRRRSGSAR